MENIKRSGNHNDTVALVIVVQKFSSTATVGMFSNSQIFKCNSTEVHRKFYTTYTKFQSQEQIIEVRCS